MVWKRAVIVVGILAEVIVAYPYANGYPYSSSPVLAAVVGTKVTVGGSSQGSDGGCEATCGTFIGDQHVFEVATRSTSAKPMRSAVPRVGQCRETVIAWRTRSKGGVRWTRTKTAAKSSYSDEDSGRSRRASRSHDNRHNLRNNYNDHLYNKELRNDQLR
ncbi:hypothetical protein quinque_015969 [Culex quinquefasciatus]